MKEKETFVLTFLCVYATELVSAAVTGLAQRRTDRG